MAGVRFKVPWVLKLSNGARFAKGECDVEDKKTIALLRKAHGVEELGKAKKKAKSKPTSDAPEADADISKLSNAKLYELAKEKGLNLDAGLKKAELIDAIEAAG